jgi:DNA-binding beta-propeller fold protein YncE
MNIIKCPKYTSDGKFIKQWGSMGTGDGEFDRTHGIAIDSSDNVYVSDMGNFVSKSLTAMVTL